MNDISGLTFDDRMAQVVADSGAGLIIMHTRGKPDNMQKNTRYDDLLSDVIDFLAKSLEVAETAGVDRNKIAIDPGIGFGKDVSGNLELVNRAHELLKIGRPIMLGTSRKSFIGDVLNKRNPADRLYGSLATIALGYANGVRLFRVHDVAASREVVDLAKAVCEGGWSRN